MVPYRTKKTRRDIFSSVFTVCQPVASVFLCGPAEQEKDLNSIISLNTNQSTLLFQK